MNRKTKALFNSGVALLLCISMLLGTTWAWFTDSVVSTANVISTGTLKVGLYHTNSAGANDTKVTNETKDLFQVELWEPGVAAYENFAVKNEGSLWLKYRLGLNALDQNYVQHGGSQFGLSQALVAGVVPGGILDSNNDGTITREEAVGQITQWKKLNEVLENGFLAPKDEADSTTAYGVVIWWQPSAGDNKWNVNNGANTSDGQPLTVDLGVTLSATQYSREEDSFGSDYDGTAEFPELDLPVKVTVTVPSENGLTTQDVTMQGRDVKATVPAGVQLADGEQTLTLTVTEMEQSGANVSIDTTEEMVSLDVHIAGVAEGNTTPIIVELGPVMPKYLNMGNYHLYHVEGGSTNPMTLVGSVAEVDAHNEFYYDANTGSLTVAMATFSEVAVVADTENAWEGEYDYSWYVGKSSPYTIVNGDQLAAFGAIVGGMAKDTEGNAIAQDSFAGKTVNLIADINLGDKESENGPDLIFYPIGYYNSTGSYEKVPGGTVTSGVESFEGTFDGQGHTISNFYQNTWEMFGDYNSGYSGTPNHYKDAMGLFGYVLNGTVKNLTVENFSSDGEFTPTGVIAAYADGDSKFSNIAITNCNPCVYNTGNGGIIGIAGDTGKEDDDHITLTNITVDNSNKISALWGSYDVACGGLVGMYRGNVDSSGNATGDTISFTDCHVSAIIDVYNDVCGNYQYYAYRYAGMIIGSVRHNTKDGDKTIPDMTGISATDCTVNYGDWNDYYYCEFEKNSIASYSEDYQFSRVPHSELDFTDSNSNGVVDANERDSVTGCKHTHTAEENHQAIYLPFHQLFTGYGWGVNSKGLTDFAGITNMDITEGNQEESVEKFQTKFTGDFLYRVGNQNTVTLGSLFAAKDGVTINNSGVVASIVKVDETMNVSGTFKEDTSNWENGTIQFSGTGVVKVTIQDYNFCTPTELYLEVVDAKNVTSASGSNGTDIVLLNDVRINSGATVTYDNCFVYGNGFTFDASGGLTKYVSSQGWGVINLSDGATLDNLVITGDVYETYGAYSENDYNTAAVASISGTIQNCWISNCAAPVMLRGSTTITDTTLYGGTVANAIIKGGINTFENVTTVNYNDERAIVGAGIVIHSDADEKTELILNGTLKQYNFLCETPEPTDSNAKILYDAMFGDSCSGYQFGTTPNRYVNTGIISMTASFGAGNITDNAATGYTGQNVTIKVGGFNVDGYVYTQPNTVGSVNNGYVEANDTHKATVQGDYLPTFAFDLGDQEVSYDGDSDSRYLYGDASGVLALYQDGDDALTLNLTDLASATKYGQGLTVTAVCKNSSGSALTATNGVVTLSNDGAYTLVFTVTDNVFYNADGTKADRSVARTYTIPLNLSVKAADVKDAVVVISPTTLEGSYEQTGNFWDYNYKLKLEFLNCISVTDYTASDTSGSTVDLAVGISTATLANSSNDVWSAASVITITYTNGRVLTVNLSKFAGSSPGTKTASVVTDGGVYFLTDGALNNKPTDAEKKCTCTITSVSFKGNNGATITNDTDVSVSWPVEESSGSGCFAEGTTITLADGTCKPIEQVAYEDELLAWDFNTGAYAVTVPSLIEAHEAGEYRVLNLKFADGTVARVIVDHGFFDVEENNFVFIDEENVASYIGHEFVKVSGDGNYEQVELTGCEITVENVSYYTIQTAIYNNCIAENLFTLTSPSDMIENEGWFDYFEIGQNMKYDEAKMQADIEKYGLYTYEDFEEYVTYEQFVAFNGPYLKVLVGRGVVTFEQILALIATYVPG